jgi:hypothetical protein
MKYARSAISAPTQRLMLAFVIVAAIVPSAPRAAVHRPDPASPLATDNRDFYAIAGDRQTILVSRPSKPDWLPLASIPGARIRGLAWGFGRLYFTNDADASVQYLLTDAGNRPPVVIHRGAPLVGPGELAFIASGVSPTLVVADAGAGTLFRIVLDTAGQRPSPPAPIEIPLPISRSMFITAWPPGEVLISDPESGLLAQVTNVARKPLLRRLQERRDGMPSLPWHQRPTLPGSVPRQGYPGVESPGAIAVYNGIFYVIDTRSRLTFAAGIHDTRAIRLPVQPPVPVVSRLIVNPVTLTALEESTGRLLTWPRIVPSVITLLPGARMQSLFPVIEYLSRRKLLLTRQVEVTGSLEETLKRARMTWPERGEPAEPVTAEGRFASFCLLNPSLCTKGLPSADLASGTRIVLADLYAERFTFPAQVTLDGTQTLGAIVDASIASDEFKAQKEEAHLKRLNGYDATSPVSLREMVKGQFRISREEVRYVIPIEASELRAGTEFRRLEERVQRSLRIDPLERVLTSAASRGVADHPNDADCTRAREALVKLIETIDFVPSVPTRTVFVGVAEKNFDVTHRDFVDPATKTRVLYVLDRDTGLLTPSSASVAQPPAAPGGEPVNWPDKFRDDDHGTAVAALIAGRTRAYHEGPGFTRALIGMFTHADDATALAGDIERALNNDLISVVNLSLSTKPDTEFLRTLIEKTAKMTLFVVAAPKEAPQQLLCTGNQVYFPACHGGRFPNVLVVGGTKLDGKQIDAKSPIGEEVHLFAPSEGYYSAGQGNSYVPVAGTSFATALVSAAAAMLSATGDTPPSPAAIRNRLITTANVIDMPVRQQWARVLDVKRALSHRGQSVIVDANTDEEMLAEVVNPGDTLVFKAVKGGRIISVPVSDLRRLARVKGNAPIFDLAYAVPGPEDRDGAPTEKLAPLVAVRPHERPWTICYMPLGADGLRTGAPRTCIDLAEKKDYVSPLR